MKLPWVVWGSQDVVGRDRWPPPTRNDWSSEGTNGRLERIGTGREQDSGVAGMKQGGGDPEVIFILEKL